MHASVMAFVRAKVVEYALGDRSALEVGSLNVNGSVRSFFTGPYYGIDMRPGMGVDEVVNAHDLDGHGVYDVIICTEMLEHDDAPWVSIKAMSDCAHEGTILLLTCRGYDRRGCFPVHEHPLDLWRFSCEGIDSLLWQGGWEPLEVKPDPEAPGVFAVARKT